MNVSPHKFDVAPSLLPVEGEYRVEAGGPERDIDAGGYPRHRLRIRSVGDTPQAICNEPVR